MPKKKLSIKVPLILLRGYQFLFSPDHGAGAGIFGRSRCRFFPSCSEYSAEAIRQYGLLAGSMVSLKRICRCNPWNRGGYNPIKKRSQESRIKN